jgi:hypothetical protein
MARAKAKPGLSQLTPEEVAFMKEDKQREQAYAEEAKYRKLIKELQAIEVKIGSPREPAYLTEENEDLQNVPKGLTENHPDFWKHARSYAETSAGIRAWEMGHDINKLIGRNIY